MFFNWLGTIEIECDSPAYSIVQACRKLGFYSPEDVRWCQQSNALPNSIQQHRLFKSRFLKWLIGKPEPGGSECVCGQKLPRFESYSFTLRSNQKHRLLLGQCDRCKTIFWKEL
jgi:hypothetical protein